MAIFNREQAKRYLKTKPKLKQLILALLMPRGEARPRWWVRVFIVPFVVKKGRRVILGKDIRWDILPFNRVSVGMGTKIEDRCVLNNGMGDICIGSRTLIGISDVIIGPVQIGDDCILAQHVVLSGLDHGYRDPDIPPVKQPCLAAPIVIEDACWIGANAVIAKGVRLGRHSVVGAGSVVTRDVPAYCVAAGNPAKIIKQYDPAKEQWISQNA